MMSSKSTHNLHSMAVIHVQCQNTVFILHTISNIRHAAVTSPGECNMSNFLTNHRSMYRAVAFGQDKLLQSGQTPAFTTHNAQLTPMTKISSNNVRKSLTKDRCELTSKLVMGDVDTCSCINVGGVLSN